LKKRIYLQSILASIVLFGLTSCSAIIQGLYGIKNSRTVDERTILRYSEKYAIPAADSYELEPSYISFLSSLNNVRYAEQSKNHYQPLQALYYDKEGQLKSFQVNCFAGGFPNLKWDRNETFTTFPPKNQAPIDSIVLLDTQLKYLKPLSQTKLHSADGYDYIVIVYWSRFMGRQSKRLIRYVQENSKLASTKKVKVLYANTDNIFGGQ